MDEPWEHPDWYDLHDTAATAGNEREPEHYRELLLALPPLGRDDHLLDVGAGTGKLARLIAEGYPELGRLTMIEPNTAKLERARQRLTRALPTADIGAVALEMGVGDHLGIEDATLATVGSVLMPTMTLAGGTLGEGRQWAMRTLAEIRAALVPGAWLYLLETLAPPWAAGGDADPVRRLHMNEFMHLVGIAGFEAGECMYRFRDRVIIRSRKPI